VSLSRYLVTLVTCHYIRTSGPSSTSQSTVNSIKRLDKQGQKKEEFKPMGLNKSDLKRYYPEIYEQYYGEGTEDAARRKLEREKDILEQRMKDDYYNYVPKQKIKTGFGGKKFGEGSKKSKGFGSSGFGSGK
jgi:hypothetical protein